MLGTVHDELEPWPAPNIIVSDPYSITICWITFYFQITDPGPLFSEIVRKWRLDLTFCVKQKRNGIFCRFLLIPLLFFYVSSGVNKLPRSGSVCVNILRMIRIRGTYTTTRVSVATQVNIFWWIGWSSHDPIFRAASERRESKTRFTEIIVGGDFLI